MERELPGLLDGVDEPATVEELEAVVRRAGQRRRATLIAGGVGLLLCGAMAGAVVRGPLDGGATGATGAAGAAEGAQAPKPPTAGMASAKGDVAGAQLTHLFRREANG